MEIENSPLQLKSKQINLLKVTPTKCSIKDYKDYLTKIDKDDKISLDFQHGIAQENKNSFRVNLKLEVNKKQRNLIAYIIDVDIDYFFEIKTKEKVTKKVFDNLSQFSSLNIAIADLRYFLKNCTSSFGIPPFVLPTIDMTKLFKDKQNQVAKLNDK